MLPELVHTALENWFLYPESPIYCQVATLLDNRPHLRTMLLYDITKEGALIFLTGTDTQKWRDLQHHTKTAVCIFSPEFGQIVAEGAAQLKTSKKESEETKKYWGKLSSAWREVYHAGQDDREVPDTFGVIRLTPERWEVLQLNKQHYLKSIRKEFQLTDGAWIMSELRPA